MAEVGKTQRNFSEVLRLYTISKSPKSLSTPEVPSLPFRYSLPEKENQWHRDPLFGFFDLMEGTTIPTLPCNRRTQRTT